ncbi:MAG: hypothetical protein KBD06_04770, partial [Candidatus Pacebacteria bacterium]|nr:hypothetical protein [Candidatus Paceibacterota bacterium]
STGGAQGMGEQIGLFVKCETIAQMGWPLPTYKTECPGGFGSKPNTSTQSSGRTERGTSLPTPTIAPASPPTSSGQAATTRPPRTITPTPVTPAPSNSSGQATPGRSR